MQTTTIRSTARPASGYWTYPDAGTRTKGYPARRQKRTADAQTVRRSDDDFLTAVFASIPVSRFSSIYSSRNYNYLYQSVKNYAKLLGAKFDLEAKESDFDGLYKSLDALLPGNQYVDISCPQLQSDSTTPRLMSRIPVHPALWQRRWRSKTSL